jgi:5-formyltetrahydrofolate cyclo-ligase
MTAEAKAVLRETVLRRRGALPSEERALFSDRILEKILGLPDYGRAGVVLAYASIGAELQTERFLECVLDDGKILALPRVERGGLRLYGVGDLERDLAPGTWGIREPIPGHCPTVDPGGVDLALVPGVAFDPRGRRLGYGGGYYDRLLQGGLSEAARIVAGAFEVQVVDEVPVDASDVPVDMVVTETVVYPRDMGNRRYLTGI